MGRRGLTSRDRESSVHRPGDRGGRGAKASATYQGAVAGGGLVLDDRREVGLAEVVGAILDVDLGVALRDGWKKRGRGVTQYDTVLFFF